jgi:3-deoxy-D-manno-octulosonic-acid transferase
MAWLLNLIYLAVIAAASPWLLWQAVRKGKYREGFAAKFLGSVPLRSGDRPCFWVHAVSVGEVNLIATLLAEFERQRPGWDRVISTTTMTGYALAKKKYPHCTVCYCPLDFSWAVRRAIARIRPTCLVLAELELWPNLIAAAKRAGAEVVIVNGRLSDRSFRGYCRLRPLVARVLRRVDLIAAQNEEYAERFTELGARPERVYVTGSLKFDGAQSDRANPTTRRLAALAGFRDDDLVFLAGSTQEPEESLALDAFRRLVPVHPRLRLVIVPRHPDRFDHVAQLLDVSGISWTRRSKLVEGQVAPDARVLLVDAIGELGAWWGTAAIAFVGGSLGKRGGQNMIEPAAYGAAVSFGPNTWNFRDIVNTLLAEQAAIVVPDGRELVDFVARCLDEPHFAAALGSRARHFVARQQGATQRTWQLIEAILPDVQPAASLATARRAS